MEEIILKELKFINMQLQEFDTKLKAQKEEICTELDTKLKSLKEEIDIKLKSLKEEMVKDTSKAFDENMNSLNDTKNRQQEEILNELREHKVRTLKGVKAFERALTAV